MVGRPLVAALLLVSLPVAAAANLDWPQRMIGAVGTGLDGSGIVVAVLDSGLDHDHPALAGTFWQNPADPPNGLDDDLNGLTDDVDGWDYCNDATPRRTPGFYHGTFVAGIVAGSGNGGGVKGVAPGARLMDLQVYCDDNAYPAQEGQTDILYRDTVREGLRYAIDHAADIIVMSLQLWGDEPSGLVAGLLPGAEEFQDAHDQGILLVGAAGNFGTLGPDNPGGYPNVLTVGATTGCGFKHGFSNHGSGIDLWAPGRAYGPVLGGGHRWESGTSYATPLVAGAAALLLQKEPGLAPDVLAGRLRDAARPSGDGPVLDLHGLLGMDPAPGMAALRLDGPTEVGGRSFVQYAYAGDEPDLLELAYNENRLCINRADPAGRNFTFYVHPGVDPVPLAARPLGATWSGPWLNQTFTYHDGAAVQGERPVLVAAGAETAGERPTPAPALLLPMLAALLLSHRRGLRRA